MWDELYQTYVEDKYHLGIKNFIQKENGASLQTVTGVMLEATRKGLWKADAQKISKLAHMHTDLVKKLGAESSDFSAKNEKLQDYIAGKLSSNEAKDYKGEIQKMKSGSTVVKNGKVLKKEETNTEQKQEKVSMNGLWIGVGIIVLFVGLIILIKKRREE